MAGRLDERGAYERNKQIESQLKEERKQFKDKIRNTMRLVLVGAGESGKSTIVKQMKILHKGGFTDEERRERVIDIRRNVHDAILTIGGVMSTLNDPVELGNPELQPFLDYILDEGSTPHFQLDEKFYDAATALWADEGIQACYNRSNEYQLIDCAKYFLDSMDRVRQPDYVPTDQDILRCRVMTTGVLVSEFQIKTVKFHLLDVGGQREERIKWLQLFSDVTAMLFVVAASSYDMTLREENKNRLSEALDLYKSIWNHKYLRYTSVVLFLNKQDILAEKIKSGRTKLGDYFKDYQVFSKKSTIPDEIDRDLRELTPGCCGFSSQKESIKKITAYEPEDLTNYQRAEFFRVKMYIKSKFEAISTSKSDDQKFRKNCYPHFTCAVDTENIKHVFDSCRDMIQRLHLANTGIVQ
ncbi:guanine nucleotide-binding protein G(s) subunit alpha-like [Anneissia japonica]|uniref:guanine nucleotide-binding protein G(s) subunit alpha-like n=1 Tax=Anneissia japonica TaxID=1529436 RepID=UPI00142553C1|nr:guanine nucleotide-binding protein G(s) subunit alpha-like [Anneissia japonica]XP_033095425.1 guanine nucleotide-binding protein G(s) subunit alpha-like [Anneissia japonica]XP_033095426.1 guanine nucleotide-binding protein G(s) subunit alpha-like [Anneissia japonica]XP_033095427.1 guanine nucleotide-binding protein G(s) subunit alpha-like [Anneissia japonica]XP_033095428.1 guanine nucleotide-binding protein G(s) subunit alpha-like [Anneissia japonica]